MNAGKDYKKAKAHAQANADLTGKPWYLWNYGGTYWTERWRPAAAAPPPEVIHPTKKVKQDEPLPGGPDNGPRQHPAD